jgi:hypothetical protein
MGEIAQGVQKVLQPVGKAMGQVQNQALGALGQTPGGQLLGQANESLGDPMSQMGNPEMMGGAFGDPMMGGSLLTSGGKGMKNRSTKMRRYA